MLRLATKFKPEPNHFQMAQEAELKYAELWLNAALLEDAENVANLAAQYEMGYALHFPNRAELTEKHLENLVKLYEATQSEVLVIHDDMHSEYAEPLSTLAPQLCLAVENHRLSVEEFDRWADGYPFLTLDVEHVWKFTLWDAPLASLESHLQRFLDRFGHKVAHVHLPGYLPDWAEHRPMYCSREMIYLVLSLLDDHNYDGLVVSETEIEFQNEFDLRMDVLLVERWRRVWSKAANQESAA